MRILRECVIAAVVSGASVSPANAAPSASAAEALLENADASVRAGRKQEALELLAKSEALELDAGELGHVVRLYENLWENCRASTAAARGVRLSPKNRGAWVMYADASAFCGRRAEAMAALDVIQTFELSPELWDQVPYLYLYMGDYRKSLESSGRYVQKYPDDVWHWLRRAEAAIGAGDRPTAFEALAKAGALTSEPTPNPGLDGVYARLGERAEAQRIIWILIYARSRIDADSRTDWINEARKRERRLSLQALAQARRRTAADAGNRKNIALIYGEIARQATSLGGPDRLRRVLTRAGAAVQRGEKTERFEQLAQGYVLAQEDADAAALFATLIDDEPEGRPSIALLRTWDKEEADRDKLNGFLAALTHGAFPARDGAKREASDFLVQVSTLNGGNGGLSFLIASLYAELGDRKSLEIFQTLFKAEPENADILIAQARAAARFGERDSALRSLERAERAAPEKDRQHAIALLYQDAGASDRAISMLRRLASAYPSDARLLYDEGVAEFLGGDADGAARTFLAATKLDPLFLDGYLSLGAACEKRGKPREAVAAYEKALALKALGEDARAALLDKLKELRPKAEAE